MNIDIESIVIDVVHHHLDLEEKIIKRIKEVGRERIREEDD